MPDSLTVNIAGRDLTLDRSADGSIAINIGFPVGTIAIPKDTVETIFEWYRPGWAHDGASRPE